jgi:alpha-1,2-mannosyltransferase
MAVIVAPAFEPFVETLLFGQINLLLVLLVTADMLLLVGRGDRLARLGNGLAAAVRRAPRIFIGYLAVMMRWRAAIVASATAVTATALAAAVVPGASLDRAPAWWNLAHPGTAIELAGALVAATVWYVRVRKAYTAGDELTGFALTGLLGCLVSPVSWVHHLAWLAPALGLLVHNLLAHRTGPVAGPGQQRPRWLLLATVALAVAVVSARFGWRFDRDDGPLSGLLATGYLWLAIALLLILPIRRQSTPPADGPARLRAITAAPVPA